MVRPRDNRSDGTVPPARSGAAARHADDPSVGPARHLGATHRTPTWLKATTIVISVLLVGVIAFGSYWFIRLQGNISKQALGAGNGRTEDAVNGQRTGCRS